MALFSHVAIHGWRHSCGPAVQPIGGLVLKTSKDLQTEVSMWTEALWRPCCSQPQWAVEQSFYQGLVSFKPNEESFNSCWTILKNMSSQALGLVGMPPKLQRKLSKKPFKPILNNLCLWNILHYLQSSYQPDRPVGSATSLFPRHVSLPEIRHIWFSHLQSHPKGQ